VTGIAAVTSATQLVTTVAKMAVNGRYPQHSKLAIAADIYSAVQLTTYAFGYFSKQTTSSAPPTVAITTPQLSITGPVTINSDEVTVNESGTSGAGYTHQQAASKASARKTKASAQNTEKGGATPTT
jgi:hypothetical protein